MEKVKEMLQKNWKQSFIVVTLAYLFIQKLKAIYKSRDLPPGPIEYPFFGSFFDRLLNPHFGKKIAQKYGNITSFYFFNRPNILINNSNVIKKIWKKFDKDILYRNKESVIHNLFPNAPFITHYKNEMITSLIGISGQKWKIRRKHAQTSLFRLLTNKKINSIMNQTLKIVNNQINIVIQNNKYFYPRNIFMFAAFNTIFVSCFGESLNYDSKIYKELSETINASFRDIHLDVLSNQLKFLLYFKYFHNKVIKVRIKREKIIEELVNKRMKIYNKNKPETYIDYSLNLYKQNKLKMGEILADTFFLFAAGQDTTSSTLEFGIVLLGKNIKIQKEMRNILSKYYKQNELFHLNYIKYLPEFKALVHEILRISSVVPFGVTHEVRKDVYVDVKGKIYRIPKDTEILYNVQYIQQTSKLNDENWVNNGMEFCLENWLGKSKDGSVYFKINDSFISFGIGRRDCVGKMLAMKELYIIIGHLLMNYEWELVNKNQEIKIKFGVTTLIDPPIPIKIQKL